MYRCERMKLLLCSLLLASLHTRSSWSVSSGTVDVTQTPDVSVMEGETVNISCCWPTHFERVRVTWKKNQTLKTEHFNNSQRSQQKEISNCSHLTFTNVTRGDSGRYICCVTMEIPFLNKGKGDGTFITVRDNTTDHTTEEISGSHREEVFIYVLRCLPILTLVITFFYVNNFRTKAQPHTSAAPGNKLTSARRIEEKQEEEEQAQMEI
ncbi:uncharacterized protein LOC115023402 isoform X4 [Cottoperca gobio]|uniref:Uncharacterized protein LOC115023402 isoform X4 n=1 Tax=Cottoperca gobio TaxID=56716 RepID=A0A6J2RJ52_COTGO|nr:uncharacterized protein LOC115023402 isoform X4 [Cottoperca gobio]